MRIRRSLLPVLMVFGLLAQIVFGFTFNNPTFPWSVGVGKGSFYFDNAVTFDGWGLSGGTYQFTNLAMSGAIFDSIGFSAETASTEMHITRINATGIEYDLIAAGAATQYIYVGTLGTPITVSGGTFVWNGGTKIATISTTGTVTVQVNWASTSQYVINLSTSIPSVEVGMMSLITATCLSSTGVCYNDSVTFTIDGVHFKWVDERSRYEGIARKAIAGTFLFDTVDSFTNTDDWGAAAGVSQVVSVTWLTSRIEDALNEASGGDLPGTLYYFITYDIGGTVVFTIIALAISVAVYQFSGAEVVLVLWLLMWGAWSTLVHGAAQQVAIVLLIIGGGALLVKAYLGRREGG